MKGSKIFEAIVDEENLDDFLKAIRTELEKAIKEKILARR